jgi:ADP-ribose pyrophosphatase YjhB (NUDIX family)
LRPGKIDNMGRHEWPLSKQEFKAIYSKVPRLTVEIVVRNAIGEIYTTRRSIEPCRGQWHLPGGTVQFGESLLDAVSRVADRELSIKVKNAVNCGYIEYPSHYKRDQDDPDRDHPVGLVFEVRDYSGSPVANTEASDSGWFSELPAKMHADQGVFLGDHGYLGGELNHQPSAP